MSIYNGEQNRSGLCFYRVQSLNILRNTYIMRDDYLLCYLQATMRNDNRKALSKAVWLSRNMKRTKVRHQSAEGGEWGRGAYTSVSLRNQKKPLHLESSEREEHCKQPKMLKRR